MESESNNLGKKIVILGHGLDHTSLALQITKAMGEPNTIIVVDDIDKKLLKDDELQLVKERINMGNPDYLNADKLIDIKSIMCDTSFLPNTPRRLKDAKVAEVRTETKIGRNNPCPCQSGLKYKKCCGV